MDISYWFICYIAVAIVLAVVIFDHYLAYPPNPAGSMLVGFIVAAIFVGGFVVYQNLALIGF